MSNVYSSRTIIKVLEKIGFIRISQKGSHIKLKGLRHEKILTVIVPNHKTIAKGTFASILKQAELTSFEFDYFLNK